MSASTIQIAAVDRDEGTGRLVVRCRPGAGHVEIAIERRVIDGWRLVRRVHVRAIEVDPLRAALERGKAISGVSKRLPTFAGGR